MILTCPRCATRFLVEEEEIPPDGRKVRCGDCGEEWLAEPQLAQEAGPTAEAEAEAEAAEPPPAHQASGSDWRPAAQAEPALSPAEVPGAPAMVAPIVTARTRPRVRRPARGPGLVLALAAAVVIVLLALAVLLRGQIVRAWPASAPIYRSLGLRPLAPPPGPPAPHG